MTFSLSQLWEDLRVPAPELSISLHAPAFWKQELFWTFPCEWKASRFLVVPHIFPEQTITVYGMSSPAKSARIAAPELKRPPQRRRFARNNTYVCNCSLRL